MDFEECLRKKLLTRIKSDKELSERELSIAKNDLSRARHTLKFDKDFKWAIIKGYYSMFHATKAVLYAVGLKERSHRCISEVLKKLSEKGLLQSYVVDEFISGMEARESADYRNSYSEGQAKQTIEIAEGFIEKMKNLTKRVKENEV